MCTAVSFKTADHYFGRNLDLFYHYDERVCVTPRNFVFTFRALPAITRHHAMIGMATVIDGTPLYYEATNEKGLSAAGLNFPHNAVYHPLDESKVNVAPFELIPWLLAQYETVSEVKQAAKTLNIADLSFSAQFPATPLHWLVSDSTQSIVLESTADGLHLYENPTHVLTNNPPFPMQLFSLNNYAHLSPQSPARAFSDALQQQNYSLGLGALGLPGDLSSQSRFVRAAYVQLNARCGESEQESVSQFFHILGSVAQQKGCVLAEADHYEYTLYSSCCNTARGIYYYTTYNNSCIHAVDMHREDLEKSVPVCYPLAEQTTVIYQN